MGYIGRGNDAISNVEQLDNITFNGGTTYALTKSSTAYTPTGKNNILISIDGVVQQNNFTVSGTNIVFDWSPTSSNTCNWIQHYGVGVVNTPADDSVTTAKIADDAITYAKIQNVTATDKILGRDSSGAGIVEEISPASLRTMINVADGSNAYTHPNHSGEVTSTNDGATVIADNIVDEANLKISNAGSNSQFLQKQSGNTGGLTWATASSVGGATGVDFNDGVKARYGTDNDMEVYHDGGNGFVKNATGQLDIRGQTVRLRQATADETFIQCNANTSVDLYYDNAVACKTTSTGMKWDDGKKATFGTGNDFEIYHDGSHSYLQDVGTGEFRVMSSNISLMDTNGEYHLKTFPNGGVELYYNDVKKLETTSAGGLFSGTLHVKHSNSSATADSTYDDLVIESSAHAGMTFLTGTSHVGGIKFGDSSSNAAGSIVYDNSGDKFEIGTAGTERLRISNAGLIGTGNALNGVSTATTTGVSMHPEGRVNICYSGTGGHASMTFRNANNEIGSISHSGSATGYNTSSDYRLKENEISITDGIDRVKQLKPYRFNFKTDVDKTVDGFFAHEVSSIIPEAIIGEKDAMNPEVLYTADDELPEGKNIGDIKEATSIKPQGIDQSKIVPLLVASVQELIAENETLKTRITALENA